ncbi:MAG: hypothetical protein M3243_00780 [Thermoproteota archaeon]|nr:hypothetical protein [Thermoproteota archaeon]
MTNPKKFNISRASSIKTLVGSDFFCQQRIGAVALSVRMMSQIGHLLGAEPINEH